MRPSSGANLGPLPARPVLALATKLRDRPANLAPWSERSPRETLTIAVLPFSNLSGEPANETFADGLAEELRNALSRLDGVKVVSRTSVSGFKNSDLDAREIGRRLGAEALLEGSVRQGDGRLRLTVQLVDTADGCQLWAGKYERQAVDVFTVQDELSRGIAEELRPLLRSQPSGSAVDRGTGRG